MWCLSRREDSSCKNSSVEAFSTNHDRASMTSIKSIGDSGSPWCSPLLWEMISLGTPFSRIWVKDVASSPLIISHHIVPKLNFFMTSSRKAQETESNAFEMPNLRSKQGCLCWWRNRVICYTSIKLSWMNRFLMKVDWFGDTISCILSANHLYALLVSKWIAGTNMNWTVGQCCIYLFGRPWYIPFSFLFICHRLVQKWTSRR
jgi:hypothetical protein